MQKPGSLGIDVGGSKTLFGLFDEKFKLVADLKFKTRPDKGRKAFTRMIEAAVEELESVAKKNRLFVAHVGIGCAGDIDSKRGVVNESLNIPFLKEYNFRAQLTRLTKAKVQLMNDCYAGIYGEQQLGAARGMKHVIGVFIGTGVGGAMIFDGKLYQGAERRAGNLGNYLMHPFGTLTGSQREGVLDDLVSRTAIAGEAATLAAKQWAPALKKVSGTDVVQIGSGDLARAIKKGDRYIEQLVRSRMRVLGIALSNFIDFLNPQMVVLGGGFVDSMPELVRGEVQAGIHQNVSDPARKGLRVAASTLRKHVITTGAAKLAADLASQ